MRWPGRLKATAGIWRLKITKENWIGEPNAWLNRTTDWPERLKKEYWRARTKKKKGNKNWKGFLGCQKLKI
jgi:hypothetical protein